MLKKGEVVDALILGDYSMIKELYGGVFSKEIFLPFVWKVAN